MSLVAKLEKEEEATIAKWCIKNGVNFIKFTPMGARGYPDRIVILPGGKHIWIELKRRGKKPRPLQTYRMHQLTEQGAEALWFDNAEDCIDYLKEELNQ